MLDWALATNGRAISATSLIITRLSPWFDLLRFYSWYMQRNSLSESQHDTTMVLTVAQTTAFFESADQMSIPNATVIQLQNDHSQYDRCHRYEHKNDAQSY
jgi:hypothetical protein